MVDLKELEEAISNWKGCTFVTHCEVFFSFPLILFPPSYFRPKVSIKKKKGFKTLALCGMALVSRFMHPTLPLHLKETKHIHWRWSVVDW